MKGNKQNAERKRHDTKATKVTKNWIVFVGFMVFVCVLAPVGCGPPPLADGHRSGEELAGAVLDAVARRDKAALRALAVNEREFRANVWPSLPAARPERNLPFSYVWGDLRQKSETSLLGTLASHRAQRYELVRVTFARPATDYPAFRIHHDALFTVRDSLEVLQELRLCGSFIEQDGTWKVFSYVVDD